MRPLALLSLFLVAAAALPAAAAEEAEVPSARDVIVRHPADLAAALRIALRVLFQFGLQLGLGHFFRIRFSHALDWPCNQ